MNAAIEVDPRQCYARHPAPVSAVCAVVDGRPAGMVCTSVTAVSLEPPVLTLSIRRESRTWPRLRTSASLGVSLLAQGQDDIALAIAHELAVDRFAQVATHSPDGAALLVRDAAVSYSCVVSEELAIGDHLVAVLAVLTSHIDPDRRPMTFVDNAMT